MDFFRSNLFYRDIFKNIIKAHTTNSWEKTLDESTEPDACGIPPLHQKPAFIGLTPSLAQTILMTLSHFCETCTFLSSLWSKEKIKRRSTETLPLSHFSYFQTLSALEVFFSTQIPWAEKKNSGQSWRESNLDLFSVVSVILNRLPKSYQLVSI